MAGSYADLILITVGEHATHVIGACTKNLQLAQQKCMAGWLHLVGIYAGAQTQNREAKHEAMRKGHCNIQSAIKVCV